MILVYLLYDSINNTVFGSQVWNLLLNFLNQKKYLQIVLISLEQQIITHDYHHPKITIVQIKRYRYYCQINLILDYLNFKKHLPKKNYHLMARGPFAALLTQKIKLFYHYKPQKIIVQARGLASAEFNYLQTKLLEQETNSFTKFFKKILIKLRTMQLLKLEKKAYKAKQINQIECVSPALKQYLKQNWLIPAKKMMVAKSDLPPKIRLAKLNNDKQAFRIKYHIAQSATVYCYSGGYQAWQCPDQVVDFFKEKLNKNQNSFLLVLSKQTKEFESLLLAAKICKQNYLVLNANYHEIYQYLAIANYGLLFREKHIINWVSRPTKALEYQAAGLQIVHNQTIDWLILKNKKVNKST